MLEKRANKDRLELDFQARLAPKESVEFQELRDYQESRDDRGRTGSLETPGHRDKRVNLDGVFLVRKVRRVCQA